LETGKRIKHFIAKELKKNNLKFNYINHDPDLNEPLEII